LVAISVVQIIALAQGGELARPTDHPADASRTRNLGHRTVNGVQPNNGTLLDRVAYAVDGAESSHGEDLTMWRSDASAPQGPMQVSGAAADDVGGGDRFDLTENRAIGRAYLAHLFHRYKNWPDAIAAYNWGMGNLDNWVQAGRPADKLVAGVAAYLRRVLRDSGVCGGSPAVPAGLLQARVKPAARQQQQIVGEDEESKAEAYGLAGCRYLDAWSGVFEEKGQPLLGAPGRFYSALDKARALTAQHLPMSQRGRRGRDG